MIEVIPDRIEAGTYIIIGALLGQNLKITNLIPEHLTSVLSKLQEIGVDFEIKGNTITNGSCSTYQCFNDSMSWYKHFRGNNLY